MKILVKGATKCLQSAVILAAFATCQLASADTFHHKVKRVSKDKPITSIQVMSFVNKKYQGNPIRFKKTPTKTFKDCHTIRFLTFAGDLHTLKISCK